MFMNIWMIGEEFNEKIITWKEEFNSGLNLQITKDSDYNHSKRIWKDFKMKHFW